MINLHTFRKNPRAFSAGWIFATHSLAFSTWVIYIPYVKDRLQIDEGDLGIALFFAALGAFCILPWSGVLIRKFGDGVVTFYSTLAFCVFFLFPLSVPYYNLLCLALFFLGLSAGLMDIAMNAVVSIIEKEENIYIMSGSHGFFSLGGMVGAGVGTVLVPILAHPQWHAFMMSIFLITTNLYLQKNYLHLRGVQSEKSSLGIKTIIPILGLAIIGAFVMIGEGAVADWSAIFLKEEVLAPEIYWGLGYAGFSLMMSIGRFLGDELSKRWQSHRMIKTGGFVGLVGILLVLTSHVGITILGFSLIGLGFSVIVPELIRITTNLKDIAPAQGIATIAGAGYTGFLFGPVLIGMIAEVYSLHVSFWVLFSCVFLALTLPIKKE